MRSIREQEHELRYRRKKPAWVLLHPKTLYTVAAEDSILYSLGSDGKKPVSMIMGIPVRTVDWMPEGIVVVTDTFEDDLWDWKVVFDKATASGIDFTEEAKAYYRDYLTYVSSTSTVPESLKTTIGTTSTAPTVYFDDTFITAKPGGEYKVTGSFKVADDWLAYTKPLKGLSIGFDPAKTKEPETWDDPILEGEPDPDSIYGKALARAKRAKK